MSGPLRGAWRAAIAASLVVLGPMGALGCASEVRATGPGNEPSDGVSAERANNDPVQAPSSAAGQHLLLTVQLGAGGPLTVLDARPVSARLPRARVDSVHAWRFQLESGSGDTLFADDLLPPGAVRAEFAGPDGKMQSVHVTKPNAVFAVRVPAMRAAKRIRLFAPSNDARLFGRPAVRARLVEVALGEFSLPGGAR